MWCVKSKDINGTKGGKERIWSESLQNADHRNHFPRSTSTAPPEPGWQTEQEPFPLELKGIVLILTPGTLTYHPPQSPLAFRLGKAQAAPSQLSLPKPLANIEHVSARCAQERQKTYRTAFLCFSLPGKNEATNWYRKGVKGDWWGGLFGGGGNGL